MRIKNLVFVLSIAWLVSQCHLPSRANNITAPLEYCDERLVLDHQRDPRDGNACGDRHLDALAYRLFW